MIRSPKPKEAIIETRLAHLPGVKAAGMATTPVLADSDWESSILVEGHENKPGEQTHAYVNRVSPGYFKTLGIHLLSGRTFRESDTANSPKVVVVVRALPDITSANSLRLDIGSVEDMIPLRQPIWKLSES